MRMVPSDPDLETVYGRIHNEKIDLQPDFQRGEVWGVSKRQRLIDSILRQWHIPPVHFVWDEEKEIDEVLDGQQRLAAIRDFMRGKLTVDGKIEPDDPEVSSFDGLTFHELPKKVQERFKRFTIRVYRLEDYASDEPGELFFRLNQQAILNPAEQRNAFFGSARGQVKNLSKKGLTKEVLGFTNSRMAYEDVVARVCLTIQSGTLFEKITAKSLEKAYRNPNGFNADVIMKVSEAVERFAKSSEFFGDIRFNKATTHSWLLVSSQINGSIENTIEPFGRFIGIFEESRLHAREGREIYSIFISDKFKGINPQALTILLSIYTDRATSRVADVSSVLLRDIITWMFFVLSAEWLKCLHHIPEKKLNDVNQFWSVVKLRNKLTSEEEEEIQKLESVLIDEAMQIGWGEFK
jgi:hypothetical protein